MRNHEIQCTSGRHMDVERIYGLMVVRFVQVHF